MRRMAGALALAVALMAMPIGAQEAVPDPTQPAPPPASEGFIPADYLGQGDAFNCPVFASQADAQAVLRADPTDPNKLDADKDGIACETRPAPRDLVPVPR